MASAPGYTAVQVPGGPLAWLSALLVAADRYTVALRRAEAAEAFAREAEAAAREAACKARAAAVAAGFALLHATVSRPAAES